MNENYAIKRKSIKPERMCRCSQVKDERDTDTFKTECDSS